MSHIGLVIQVTQMLHTFSVLMHCNVLSCVRINDDDDDDDDDVSSLE